MLDELSPRTDAQVLGLLAKATSGLRRFQATGSLTYLKLFNAWPSTMVFVFGSYKGRNDMFWSDYGWSTDHWPMTWMFPGPIMMIIFMAVCAAIMFYMMRGGMMRRTEGGHALDILKERFARGEINHTEYEYSRKLLEH
jgi:putative membrane protein